MQMKIIVDTPEDYKVWLKEQTNLVTQVKALMLLQL
jgi:cytochrome c oxidase subunit 2